MAEKFNDDWQKARRERKIKKALEVKQAKLERQKQKAEAPPTPARRRPIRRKPQEVIYYHPETGEPMWTRYFMIKKVGFVEATFERYRRKGWVPPAYKNPENGRELFTKNQIKMLARLYRKMCKKENNRYIFLNHMIRTWSIPDVKTVTAQTEQSSSTNEAD